MSISEITIATMAQCLKVRQKLQKPTLLFLGAKAGALFQSQTLYDKLQRFSPRRYDARNQLARFHQCIGILEKGQFSETEIHYILSRSLEDSFIEDTHKYIAALVKYNFFQLIATTNIDVGLEAALDWLGLRVNNDFKVFLPGISSSSSAPSLRKEDASNKQKALVKLYGELALGHYNLKQRDQFFANDRQLFQGLQQMQNWNILMVGFDPVWDVAVVPLLLPCAATLWYVNEDAPAQNPPIFQWLQASHNTHYLLGTDGDHEKFFRVLYQHVIGSAPLFDPRAEPAPSVARQPISVAVSKAPEPQSLAHAPSSSRVQHKVDVLLLAATERELTALRDQQHLGTREYTIGDRTCYDLGKVGDATVCLLRAHETDSSLSEQIQELSPACIIILGTAWGFNYKGQIVGSLLIPDRIVIHGIEAENKVSTQLIKHFHAGNLMLNRKTKKLVLVTFGPMFSSTKVIEDPQTAFRDIHESVPDAIGIVTSGATLFSLAQNHQANCLLVTGVSALVDAAKDQDEADAEDVLRRGAEFILQVIALGGFHDMERDGLWSR